MQSPSESIHTVEECVIQVCSHTHSLISYHSERPTVYRVVSVWTYFKLDDVYLQSSYRTL